MKTPFSKPILAAAVAALFVAPSVGAVDVVCEETNGCEFYATTSTNSPDYWEKNNQKISEDKELNLSLKAQNYINTPATATGIEEKVNPDGSKSYSFYPDKLIGISSHFDDMRGNLTVPTGTNLTLSQARDSSYLISLDNSNATIAEGVNLTVNAGYGETNGLTHPDKTDMWEAGDAIYVSADLSNNDSSQINTSANITLNGMGANGIVANGRTNVNASNHSITLNGYFSMALQAHDSANINTNNVNISGSANTVAALEVSSDGDFASNGKSSTIKLENSKVTLAGEESIGGTLGGGNVIINNTPMETSYSFISYPNSRTTDSNTININNSNVSGKKALLAITPQFLRSFWTEDELSANQADVSINANNSQLTGGVILDKDLRKDGEPYGKININLSNNSLWNIQQNSEIDSLKLEKSTVNLSNPTAGQFNTLTINGDLSGDGIFRLNSDIAGGKADLLNVKGKVSGSHVLNINNTKAEPANTDGKIPVVKTGSSGADAFKLGNANGVVEAGKYLYALKQEGSDWNLVYDNTQSTPTPTQPATPTPLPTQPVTPTQPANPTPPPTQPVTPTQPATPNPPPTQPVTPIVPITPSQPVAPTPTVNKNFNYSLMGTLAHAQAAALGLQQQNQVLNERQAYLHEHTRSQGLWTNGNISETERKGSQINGGNASGFTDKTKAWQLGYDYRLPNGYVGLLSGQSRHELDYDVDLYENSKVVGDTFALYGGAHFNTWFVDGTLRHTRYTASNPQFARDRFRVNSLNIQGGKQVKLNEQWSLVPQAAITIGRLSGSNMMENSTLLQTQLGADLQGKFAINGSAWLQPKIGMYYVGDHRGVDVKFNNETFRAPSAGHRVAAKVGTDVLFNQGASRIGLQFQTEHGSRLKRPYGVEMGFRHSW